VDAAEYQSLFSQTDMLETMNERFGTFDWFFYAGGRKRPHSEFYDPVPRISLPGAARAGRIHHWVRERDREQMEKIAGLVTAKFGARDRPQIKQRANWLIRDAKNDALRVSARSQQDAGGERATELEFNAGELFGGGRPFGSRQMKLVAMKGDVQARFRWFCAVKGEDSRDASATNPSTE